MNTPTITTKRVAGSAEVSIDVNGHLVCSNFRAYQKKPKNEPPIKELSGIEGVKVYEYTEHYNVVLRIPKEGRQGARTYMERLGEALAMITASPRQGC